MAVISTFVVACVLTALPASAASITKGGELAGGKSDFSDPIDVAMGQMIEGVIGIRQSMDSYPLYLALTDSNKHEVWDFGGTATSMQFRYAPKVAGRYYLLVKNLNGFSVGTRGYSMSYDSKSATLPSGMGAPGTGVQANRGSGSIPWIPITVGVVVVATVAGYLLIRRRREERDLRHWHYEHYERYASLSAENLNKRLAAIRRKKGDVSQRLDTMAKAKPRTVLSDSESYSHVDIQMDRLLLELRELDTEEDDIEAVLAAKREGNLR